MQTTASDVVRANPAVPDRALPPVVPLPVRTCDLPCCVSADKWGAVSQWPAELTEAAGPTAVGVAALVYVLCGNTGPPRDRLPGTQAVDITRQSLCGVLQTERYMVCEKSDGVRAMMLIVPDGQYASVWLVDRRMVAWPLPGSTPNAVQWSPAGPTLLDGELVLQTTHPASFRYVAFDAPCVNGVLVHSWPLTDRLAVLIRECASRIAASRQARQPQCIAVRFKQHVEVADVYALQARIKWSPVCERRVFQGDTYQCCNDGLVFTPVQQPYAPPPGRVLKWKWPEDRSVDFLVLLPTAGEDAPHTAAAECFLPHVLSGAVQAAHVTLYAWNGEHPTVPPVVPAMPTDAADSDTRAAEVQAEWVRRTHCAAATLVVHIDETQRLHMHLRQANLHRQRRTCVLECSYDAARSGWKYKRVRSDKWCANYVKVALETLQAQVDNITVPEIADACKSRTSCNAKRSAPLMEGVGTATPAAHE